jgi:hypothetical protein
METPDCFSMLSKVSWGMSFFSLSYGLENSEKMCICQVFMYFLHKNTRVSTLRIVIALIITPAVVLLRQNSIFLE